MTIARRRLQQVDLKIKFHLPQTVENRSTSLSDRPLEAVGLSFFFKKTLAVLRIGYHSSLWRQMTQMIVSPDSCLRDIAIAIGSRHLTIEHPEMASCMLDRHLMPVGYGRALVSLQTAISQGNIDRQDLLLSCLLFVLLESLQQRPRVLQMHLRSGLLLIKDHGPVSSTELTLQLRELFVRLALQSALRTSPLLLISVREISKDINGEPPAHHDLTSLNIYVSMLFWKVYEFARMVTLQSPSNVQDWQCEYDPLLAAIRESQETVATFRAQGSNADPCAQALCGALEARCLLYEMFVDCVRSRYQTTYDKRYKTFKDAIDLLEESLKLLNSSLGTEKPTRLLFSMDLSVMPLLSLVTLLCRDPRLRRRALGLLDLCPVHEGEWVADWARKRGQAIIDFEENGLDCNEDGHPYFVPEERRIHQVADDENYAHLEVYYKPNGDTQEFTSRKIYLV